MKNKMIHFAKSIGVSKIGFTTANKFEELRPLLTEQKEKGYLSGFEEPDIERRIDPKLSLPNAKSIISIAIAYPSGTDFPLFSKKDGLKGVFCRSSWGRDYHHVVAEKLKQLEQFIFESDETATFVSMVDTGPLSDRAVARRAGIGWVGNNGSIISPEHGSYIFLGEMITNIEFEPDNPLESQCGACTKCMDACPGNAIIGNGKINAKKCLSYQTQLKEELAENYREKLGNRLFGCDTCQVVCSFNSSQEFDFYHEFEPVDGVINPNLLEVIQMTNRQFKEKFGCLAGSWRGRTPIQRNAIYGLAFYKAKEALPILEQLAVDDPREVIRDAAKWAIEKIKE